MAPKSRVLLAWVVAPLLVGSISLTASAIPIAEANESDLAANTSQLDDHSLGDDPSDGSDEDGYGADDEARPDQDNPSSDSDSSAPEDTSEEDVERTPEEDEAVDEDRTEETTDPELVQPSSNPYPDALALTRGVDRAGGQNRYLTAVAVSQRLFPKGGSDSVFIASGTAYPDGLSVSALASYAGGALLLTQPRTLPPAVRAEISRLNPKKIYIAGGTAAVSSSVEAELATLADSVTRLGGANRYETSMQIAAMFPKGSPAVVATGSDFPDALVAATASGKAGGGPVLLTPKFTVSSDLAAWVQTTDPSSVTVVGGKWSAGDQNRLKDASGRKPTILSGSDRYATSAAVAKHFWSASPAIVYSTGSDYADAMSGAPTSRAYNAPLLLTKSNCRPKAVAAEGSKQSRVLILGGTSAVATNAVTSTCPVLPSVVSVQNGYYRFGMTHRAQLNGYYCGPATAQMILSRLGYNRSTTGYALSQPNLARYEYLRTDYNRRTLYEDARMSVGMNAWMGKNLYVQQWKPNTAQFRTAVSNSFTSTGRPVVVDTQEYAGGAHYNNHPAYSTFSHLMPVEGYNPSTGQIIMLDSASHFYYGSQPSFTHSLSSFTQFLQRYGIYR